MSLRYIITNNFFFLFFGEKVMNSSLCVGEKSDEYWEALI